MKRCSKCKKTKKRSEFNKNKTKKDGLQTFCRKCASEQSKLTYDPREKKKQDIKRRYNITYKEFLMLYEKQDGKCAICHKEITRRGKDVAHIDHNHDTGKTRGLLCRECNLGLGHFKDNIELMVNAIEYLQEYNEVD